MVDVQGFAIAAIVLSSVALVMLLVGGVYALVRKDSSESYERVGSSDRVELKDMKSTRAAMDISSSRLNII